jgi:hypothetical protein
VTSDSKKPGVAFWATVVVVVVTLLLLYPATYLLAMNPIWTIPYFGGDWERYPQYKLPCNEETATKLFGWAHGIDRRIRPDFWSEKRPFRGGKQP